MLIKKNFINHCPNFKSGYNLNDSFSRSNRLIQHDCSSCLHFSPKNCSYKNMLENLNGSDESSRNLII
ncbi:MAG: hypothetical protein R3Y29_01575 [bacterium]